MGDSVFNEGVIVGRDLTAKVLAVGPAVVDVSLQEQENAAPRDLAELKEQMEDLLRMLDANKERIAHSHELLEAVRAATAEVERSEPRRGVVLALLEHVAAGVGSLLNLATVVGRLIDAAGKIIR